MPPFCPGKWPGTGCVTTKRGRVAHQTPMPRLSGATTTLTTPICSPLLDVRSHPANSRIATLAARIRLRLQDTCMAHLPKGMRGRPKRDAGSRIGQRTGLADRGAARCRFLAEHKNLVLGPVRGSVLMPQRCAGQVDPESGYSLVRAAQQFRRSPATSPAQYRASKSNRHWAPARVLVPKSNDIRGDPRLSAQVRYDRGGQIPLARAESAGSGFWMPARIAPRRSPVRVRLAPFVRTRAGGAVFAYSESPAASRAAAFRGSSRRGNGFSVFDGNDQAEAPSATGTPLRTATPETRASATTTWKPARSPPARDRNHRTPRATFREIS